MSSQDYSSSAGSSSPEWIPLNSTNVRACRYDPQAHTLQVAFHTGGMYIYYNIPKSVFNEFVMSSSPGRFVRDILSGYKYVRE